MNGNIEERDLKGELKPRSAFMIDFKMRGYSTGFWKSLTGTPAIASNKLRLNADEIASYYQVLFGNIDFAMNVPTTPSVGEAKKVGFLNPAAPTLGSAYFEIVGAVFRAISYDDDGNAETTVLTWGGEGSEQILTIEWDRGHIIFSRAGNVVAIHKTRVGKIPQAIYLINSDADDTDLSYILVKDTALVIS